MNTSAAQTADASARWIIRVDVGNSSQTLTAPTSTSATYAARANATPATSAGRPSRPRQAPPPPTTRQGAGRVGGGGRAAAGGDQLAVERRPVRVNETGAAI